MLSLFLKAMVGALIVVFIALVSKTKNYYLAGLAPLFPSFAIIAHYIVGSERSVSELKNTIVFGMWALIPYFCYLAAMYFFVDRFKIGWSIFLSSLIWCIAAMLLIYLWNIFSAS